MPPDQITQYSEFWPFYLREHSKPSTRRLHYAGTTLALAALGYAISRRSALLLLAVPLAGYSFAWTGHFFVEKNRPATFVYPLWSAVSDLRLYGLWLSGQLEPHLKAAGVRTE